MKYFAIIAVFVLVLLAIFANIGTDSSKEDMNSLESEIEQNLSNSFRPKLQGLKVNFTQKDLEQKVLSDMSVNKEKSFSSSQVNLNHAIKELSQLENVDSHSENLKMSYNKDDDEFLTEINDIEKDYFLISEWKKKHGQELSLHEYTNPKMIYLIHLFFEKPLKEVAESSLNEFGLEIADIYVLQKFIRSKDFDLALAQNKLSTLTLSQIKMTYSNESPVIERDGKLIGVAPNPTEEDMPSPSEEDSQD